LAAQSKHQDALTTERESSLPSPSPFSGSLSPSVSISRPTFGRDNVDLPTTFLKGDGVSKPFNVSRPAEEELGEPCW